MKPPVSVIVPCYNEESTIQLLLEAIRQQSYPSPLLEVLIADGRSTDGTRQAIAAFGQAHPDLRVQVVDNPARTTTAALNRALRAANGEIIIRLDGHSQPRTDYVERCVGALLDGKGDNVGGIWEIQPGGTGWAARAIAAAAAHPLGVGDAQYRIRSGSGGQAGSVDTVPFGAYRRELIDRVGFYDETLLTNEDYELNVRIRQAGGRVWLDPAIRSVYYARSTLGALLRQYGRYGYWKARMLKRYPSTIRWRQALPPAFVVGSVLLLLLAPWLILARILLIILWALYLLVLILAGAQVAFHAKDARMMPGVALAIAIMHLAWGSAFWIGLIGKKSKNLVVLNQ